MRRLVIGSRSSGTIATETDLSEEGQREYTVQEFHTWILSDYFRRQTAIRRVDLIKSTEMVHAFHEALLFHVYGALGESPGPEGEAAVFSGWRIIMERAGNLPPQAMAAQDMVQMKVAEVTKMSTGRPSHAADRVILMPCSLAPEDPQTLPFMRKRMVVKTLQLPHELFYLDRARAARYGAGQRGEPVPEHDFDFMQVNQIGYHNANIWPMIRPLCLQLESMPLDSGGYHLFSTNCYFFARTIFHALEYAHAGRWDIISQEELNSMLQRALGRPTLKPQKDEKLTPLQRAALWCNNALSGTTDMGDLIKRTAKDMAEGMQNCAHYEYIVGSLDEDDGADLPPLVVYPQDQLRSVQSKPDRRVAKAAGKGTRKEKGLGKSLGKK